LNTYPDREGIETPAFLQFFRCELVLLNTYPDREGIETLNSRLCTSNTIALNTYPDREGIETEWK